MKHPIKYNIENTKNTPCLEV